MSLRLYDTRARAPRDFEPLQPGKVTMYVCGATVQSPPHLGHVRASVSFDVLRRWLLHQGYQVTYVRNVTDVEDKVIAKAAAEGVPWWEVAARNERAFSQAYDLLGCLPATLEPRATGHIPEIIDLIERLIDTGHAYASEGDVLFDVRSYADYGALSGQRVDEVQPAGDTENVEAKRDPRDFALWKRAKAGEPSWDSPWGPGRPGWHIECSAMAVKYLGAAFDIHGGGVDLVFPHHENEIAQAVCAGYPFARYWLHNAWVTLAGEKMSKSLGNTALVTDVAKRYRPVEIRYYLAAPHYRSTIEYSESALREAAAAYQRLESFVQHAVELIGEEGAAPFTEPPPVPDEFAAAMNDDLGVPQALAVVYTAVRDGNAALAADDKDTVRARLRDVRAMLSVLGLDPLDPQWRRSGHEEERLRSALAVLVESALAEREEARARKDWAAADALRDRLREAGIEVTDTPHGPRWQLADEPVRSDRAR
ncbi:cysteine--tRNA ligase [Thermasporomyces composti]|jgi:cysteinyl-tRNA synthetase|uniref:Cysteine--tRNA ligase n=1 Tax=Thermasporomyces composti TaxID=696763 RepID=A0A3D9V5R8_THECX|nr:cysteine--tRNA ligase [Thermasporomyces composti]REF36043.1 cysteinyl-tRNA synthetase [Thermasporomyces composti]